MVTAIVDKIDLSGLGNVPPDYVHHDRVVSAGELLPIRGGVLKWYVVHRAGKPIAPAEIERARAFVVAEAEAGRFASDYGLGHAILHQSTEGTFLLVGGWRGVNELWETVSARPTNEPEGRFEQETGSRFHPVACVWEMTPIWHERNAWSRYLYSARDDAAKRAFLADTMSGTA
jgi:hypothetical protein